MSLERRPLDAEMEELRAALSNLLEPVVFLHGRALNAHKYLNHTTASSLLEEIKRHGSTFDDLIMNFKRLEKGINEDLEEISKGKNAEAISKHLDVWRYRVSEHRNAADELDTKLTQYVHAILNELGMDFDEWADFLKRVDSTVGDED